MSILRMRSHGQGGSVSLSLSGKAPVNKFTYAAISLIGAIPGGYLCFILVMAMKDYFAVMAGMMRVVVCGILGLSVVLTVIPVGILIFVKDETAESETDDDEEALEDAEDEVEE